MLSPKAKSGRIICICFENFYSFVSLLSCMYLDQTLKQGTCQGLTDYRLEVFLQLLFAFGLVDPPDSLFHILLKLSQSCRLFLLHGSDLLLLPFSCFLHTQVRNHTKPILPQRSFPLQDQLCRHSQAGCASTVRRSFVNVLQEHGCNFWTAELIGVH